MLQDIKLASGEGEITPLSKEEEEQVEALGLAPGGMAEGIPPEQK